MEGSSAILQSNRKLLLIQNKDSLCLHQPRGAADVRASWFWQRHELSKFVGEMLGNSFLWERGWAELGVSVQLGSWSPWCRGRKEHHALSSERWVCPGKLREPAWGLVLGSHKPSPSCLLNLGRFPPLQTVQMAPLPLLGNPCGDLLFRIHF